MGCRLVPRSYEAEHVIAASGGRKQAAGIVVGEAMVEVFGVERAYHLHLAIVAAHGERHRHTRLVGLEEYSAGKHTAIGEPLSAHEHVIARVDVGAVFESLAPRREIVVGKLLRRAVANAREREVGVIFWVVDTLALAQISQAEVGLLGIARLACLVEFHGRPSAVVG